MAEVKGRVERLACMPGRAGDAIWVYLLSSNKGYWLQTGGKVTLDGQPVTLAELLVAAFVGDKGYLVTLHPRTDRYEASTDAEFVTG